MSFLILFFMIAAFLIVIAGSIMMVIGGKANKNYSNKLMVARVTCQGIAIFALFMLYIE